MSNIHMWILLIVVVMAVWCVLIGMYSRIMFIKLHDDGVSYTTYAFTGFSIEEVLPVSKWMEGGYLLTKDGSFGLSDVQLFPFHYPSDNILAKHIKEHKDVIKLIKRPSVKLQQYHKVVWEI